MLGRWSCPNCGCANAAERTACRKCKFEPVGLGQQSSQSRRQPPHSGRAPGTLLHIGTGVAVGFLVAVAGLVVLVLYLVYTWKPVAPGL